MIALRRLRETFLSERSLAAGSAADETFLQRLLLVAEHTWGLDVKSALRDYEVQTPAQLATARSRENFRRVEASWQEKRDHLTEAIAALPEALADRARQTLKDLAATEPSVELSPTALGVVRGRHFELTLDGAGAIDRLTRLATGTVGQRELASADHPIGRFEYELFAAAITSDISTPTCHTNSGGPSKITASPGWTRS